MTEEERKDYLKYIENYTINDLADIFNTQNFVIQDKDKFNEILLYYHFKQNEEIEQLQQENQELKKELEEKNKPQIFIDNQDIEERYAEGLYQDYLEEENKKYKNQQKEFIEFLENEKDRCLTFYSSTECMYAYDVFKDVSSKYKEIIGSNGK